MFRPTRYLCSLVQHHFTTTNARLSVVSKTFKRPGDRVDVGDDIMGIETDIGHTYIQSDMYGIMIEMTDRHIIKNNDFLFSIDAPDQ